MCGIAVVYSKKEKIHHNLIKIAEKELSPRGPVSSTHYLGDDVYMFQSVLPIQTERVDEERCVYLPQNFKVTLYNGEIYDDHEYTSDTELIQESTDLSGTLNHTDGMFAVCVVERYGTWFDVAGYRDLHGEKRLFYYDSPNLFIVSSTPRFILKVMEEYQESVRVNEVALKDYYVTRHYISNSTSIKGIYQLPTGSKLCFNGYSSIVPIWTPRKYLNKDLTKELYQLTYQQYSKFTRDLLVKTINKMHENVMPHIATYSAVSGGVDSAIVTAMLEESSIKIQRAMTITFNEKDRVALYAWKLFNKLKCKQLVRNVDIEEYYSSYLHCIEQLCSPVVAHDVPSANLMYEMMEPESILYGGEGADELFLGYKYYENCIKSEYAQPIRNRFELSFGQEINEDYDYAFDFFLDCGYNTKDAHVKACSFIDYFHQLPNSTFQVLDLIGSHYGIECRTPFARKEVVIFGLNSPVHHIIGKKPLNDIFEKYFKVYPFPKQGFSGYPNELYQFATTDFDRSKNIFGSYDIDRVTEWKYINTEFFLEQFDL